MHSNTNPYKGVTLVELVAVIAIMLVLAVIIVPKLQGYRNYAKKNNYKASAKIIINAVDAYNSSPTPIDGYIRTTTTLSDALDLLNQNGTIVTGSDTSTFSGFSVGQIKTIEEGKFKLINDEIKALDGTDNIPLSDIE